MRSLSRPEGCISELAFDARHAGELASEARAELEAHLAGCARCQARDEALARERDELLAAAPDLGALGPGRPSSRRGRSVSVIALSAAALAIAAAALLVVMPRAGRVATDTRSKGAPHLGAVVKRGERVFAAESGARVRAGDLVRFTYSSDRERHLALINLDARGAQLYFPTGANEAGRAKRMQPGSAVALDFSVELDATEGDEQVFGLFCDAPVELAPVRAALEEKRALPELPGCTVDRIVLHKERAR